MPSRRVLVIEDDPAIRRGILDALKFHSFETLEAANGDEGLELAQTADCDLVLLDLIMPGKLGLEVLEEVRQTRPIRLPGPAPAIDREVLARAIVPRPSGGCTRCFRGSAPNCRHATRRYRGAGYGLARQVG